MKKFEVHCEWKHEAVVQVMAETKENAIKIVEDYNFFPSGTPVQKSFKVTDGWEKADTQENE